MELIFNDHSADGSAIDTDSVKKMMTSFAETANLASRFGINPIIRTHMAFWSGELMPGYSLTDWLHDGEVDVELKRRIKSYTGKGPFVEDVLAQCEEDGNKLADFFHRGKRSTGLGAAVMTFNPAISFNTCAWRIDPLQVECRYLIDTEIAISSEEVCNLFNVNQVLLRKNWLSDKLINEVSCGQDILLKACHLLAHVVFTNSSRKQLNALTGNEQVFPFVVKHLIALNCQCISWRGGDFIAGYQYKCSEESQATMNKYGCHRNFLLDDGSEKYFTWHSKINVDKWRVYFSHDAEANRVIIPYVGKHLPTVGDPT